MLNSEISELKALYFRPISSRVSLITNEYVLISLSAVFALTVGIIAKIKIITIQSDAEILVF